jgi:hypothetical protein
MEGAMLTFRIVTVGAVLITMIGGAAAQSASSAQPGKPMSLLQILLHPAEATAKPHARFAHKGTTRIARRFARHRTRLAARGEAPPPAADATPVGAWPAVDVSVAAAAPVATVPETTAAPETPALSEMVVDGHTVQIAVPDMINAIDFAADEPHEVAAPANNRADLQGIQDPVIAFARQDSDDSGDQSWISELLATLGGALAAGTVAWLVIFAVPQRHYC